MSAARHARRHRRGRRRASAARTGLLAQATAGVALAAAITAVSSEAAPPALVGKEARAVEVSSADVQLAASSSPLNVPINLLIDLINVPYNEVEANNAVGVGLVYGGPWWVTDASNIWGIDPADYARFYALASAAVPIPALSGYGDDMFTGNGIAQQFAKFLAAEMPVDPACDANGCFPNTPVSPITGMRGLDQNIWNFMMLTGAVDMPMIRNFWKVSPVDLLNGYTFGDVENSSGKVYDGLGITGTVDGEDGKSLMPWSNTTFTLEPTAPFENYFAHLMSDPSDNAIKMITFEQLGRMMQTYAAGSVIAFDPITPGSPGCPNSCEGMSQDDGFPAIVRMINNAWPGNPTLEQWLASYDAGTANVPTQQNIDRNIELYRMGSENWDFGNKPLSDEYVNYGWNPSSLAPQFYNFYKSMGIDPGPLYSDDSSTTTAATAVARSSAAAETEPETAKPSATETATSADTSTSGQKATAAESDATDPSKPADTSDSTEEATATTSTGTGAAKKAADESASDKTASDGDEGKTSTSSGKSTVSSPDPASAKTGTSSASNDDSGSSTSGSGSATLASKSTGGDAA